MLYGSPSVALQGVDNFGEEKLDLGLELSPVIDGLDKVQSLLNRREAQFAVEERDVPSVVLNSGREELHRQQVPGRGDIHDQRSLA